jgi:hypothetical protein
MCGNDFIPPFQGLNGCWGRESQGVALGCHVLRFQRNRTCATPSTGWWESGVTHVFLSTHKTGLISAELEIPN